MDVIITPACFQSIFPLNIQAARNIKIIKSTIGAFCKSEIHLYIVNTVKIKNINPQKLFFDIFDLNNAMITKNGSICTMKILYRCSFPNSNVVVAASRILPSSTVVKPSIKFDNK